jgi:glycerate 2-kinase
MGSDVLKKHADEILNSALHSVDPYHLIKEQIRKENQVLHLPGDILLNLNEYQRLIVVGAGKGAAPMARAVEELLGNKLSGGSVIVKYEHLDNVNKIKIFEAGHPVPDDNTIKSTNQMLAMVQNLTENDCVLVVLTGGGSALMESLPENISLAELQDLSKVLLGCSATIHEINCIRKHISKVKGGQLARLISPARCITLALSDVIGDDLSVIASGPTNPDGSTFSDTMAIIKKYDIEKEIPDSILNHLKAGCAGDIPETPKIDDSVFKNVSNIVIGSNRLALKSAEEKAKELGYHSLIFTSMLDGEAREIAKMMAAIIKEVRYSNLPVKKPACLLFGGEPTVHIKGKGKGGRNQELALAVSLTEIAEPYLFVSCGSDGTDGPTDAAGAMVSESTLADAVNKNLNALEYLNNNDAYHFFESLGGLIKTGPTRTNVMDLIFTLIPE